MQNIDFTERMRHEMLLSGQKLEKELNREKGNKSGQLDSSVNEMSSDLKSIVSFCQDMYLNRDEDAEKILISRLDDEISYELVFSNEEIHLSLQMLNQEKIVYDFNFQTIKLMKNKKILNNQQPFVKAFKDIIENSLNKKNIIENLVPSNKKQKKEE